MRHVDRRQSDVPTALPFGHDMTAAQSLSQNCGRGHTASLEDDDDLQERHLELLLPNAHSWMVMVNNHIPPVNQYPFYLPQRDGKLGRLCPQ